MAGSATALPWVWTGVTFSAVAGATILSESLSEKGVTVDFIGVVMSNAKPALKLLIFIRANKELNAVFFVMFTMTTL